MSAGITTSGSKFRGLSTFVICVAVKGSGALIFIKTISPIAAAIKAMICMSEI